MGTIYFCKVCFRLIEDNALNAQGILIGHHLFKEMKLLYDRTKNSDTTHPGRQFPNYGTVIMPTKNEWSLSVSNIAFVCLQASSDNVKCKSKKTR